MAEIQVQPGPKFTIKGTGQYIIGDASDDTVSTYLIHIVDGGSFSGSITPQARTRAYQAQTGTLTQAPTGSGSTLDDIAFVNTAYFNEATGVYSTSAIVAVPALFSMRSSGMVVCLNCTSLSAGSAIVYVSKVFGASA